jgi:hypothetical protein
MGILPMSIAGVPPVSSFLLPFPPETKKKKKQCMGKMPMRLTPVRACYGSHGENIRNRSEIIMTRRNLTAAMLTLAFASCLVLADDSTTKPIGLVPAPGVDPNAAKAAPGATTAATQNSATSAAASEPAEEEIDLPPYYQVMAKETDMPEAQQKKVSAECKKFAADVQAWDKGNGEEINSLQAELVATYRERDKDNIALLKTKLADMHAQRKDMEKKFDTRVEALLTEKQRTAWEGYLLYDKVITPFAGLKLEDDQQLRARNICTRAMARLLKVKDNKVEADKIYDELHQSIRERVLTQAQRDKLDHPTTAPATAPDHS